MQLGRTNSYHFEGITKHLTSLPHHIQGISLKKYYLAFNFGDLKYNITPPLFKPSRVYLCHILCTSDTAPEGVLLEAIVYSMH